MEVSRDEEIDQKLKKNGGLLRPKKISWGLKKYIILMATLPSSSILGSRFARFSLSLSLVLLQFSVVRLFGSTDASKGADPPPPTPPACLCSQIRQRRIEASVAVGYAGFCVEPVWCSPAWRGGVGGRAL